MGVFTGDGSSLTTIASDITSLLGAPQINDAGTVAFYSEQYPIRSIRTGDGGQLTTVADDTGEFNDFSSSVSINNDGSAKAGYLAPSVEGQAMAILEALEFSDVDPESVTYIETHGTGTPVGDPIEVSALTSAYGSKTDKKQYCAIGSVKGNIGHLDTAAGVASIIKTTLALENKELPPSLHYHRPNPEIDFESTPFYVNAELKEWHRQEQGQRKNLARISITPYSPAMKTYQKLHRLLSVLHVAL